MNYKTKQAFAKANNLLRQSNKSIKQIFKRHINSQTEIAQKYNNSNTYVPCNSTVSHAMIYQRILHNAIDLSSLDAQNN